MVFTSWNLAMSLSRVCKQDALNFKLKKILNLEPCCQAEAELILVIERDS